MPGRISGAFLVVPIVYRWILDPSSPDVKSVARVVHFVGTAENLVSQKQIRGAGWNPDGILRPDGIRPRTRVFKAHWFAGRDQRKIVYVRGITGSNTYEWYVRS